MSQEVAVTKTEKTDLATFLEPPTNWGTESVSGKDVAAVFLSIDSKTGEIKKSTTGEVLGGTDKEVTVIPVKHMKEHQYVDITGKTMSRSPYQEGLPSGERVMINGVECERIGAHIFFFLISGREQDGVVVYSARRTSRWAAEKTILPALLAGKRLGNSIADMTFKFKSEQKINDAKQKYFVCSFYPGDLTTKEQRALAYAAYQELSTAEVKLTIEDDSGSAH